MGTFRLQAVISLLLLPVLATPSSLAPANTNPAWQSLPGSVYGGAGTPWGGCAAASWPPTELSEPRGRPLVPQAPDDEMRQMLRAIDPAHVHASIMKLVSFGTRHTLSEASSNATWGIGAARDWLLREMQSYANGNSSNTNDSESSDDSKDSGCGKGIRVYLDSYVHPTTGLNYSSYRPPFAVNISNVVAEVRGSSDPARVYVVTGHYDSRNLDGNDYRMRVAPGADDDASGVAVVLEMARVVLARAAAGSPPRATMIFAAVAAEEQGLLGARHLARSLRLREGSAAVRVHGMWNNDIVGTGSNAPYAPINEHTVRVFLANPAYPSYPGSAAGLDTIAHIGGLNDGPAHNLGRFAAEVVAGAAADTDVQVALVNRPDRFLRGGDHSAFIAEGWPASIRWVEPVEEFRHQHQNVRPTNAAGGNDVGADIAGTVAPSNASYGDIPEFVDPAYVVRVARANLASMWAAANAPAAPSNVRISQRVGFTAGGPDTPADLITNESQFCWGDDSTDGSSRSNGSQGSGSVGVPVAAYELVWRSSANLQWTHSLSINDPTARKIRVNLPKDVLQFGVRSVGKDGKKSPAVFPVPSTSC